MLKSQLIHSRDDAETKWNRPRASKWSNDQLEGCKFLMEPHNKTTKGTHTHTPPYKTSSRIRPSLVPLRDFAHLLLLGWNKSDQGEESGTEPSSCVSCGPSSVEAEGVPVVGEDANSDTFYRIVMLA